MGQKFRRNRSISHGLGDTSNFKFYHFCKKNSKWLPFLERGKLFLKNMQSILFRYPVCQKFCRNRSISHGLGGTSNFKFYHFSQIFENTKWLPFLERVKFLKIGQSISLRYLVAQNFVEIALSRMVQEIQAFLCCAIL